MLTIEKYNQKLELYQQKIKEHPEKDTIEELHKFDISPHELVTYQNIKSLAMMHGIIDGQVAMHIYRCLSNWDEIKLAERMVLTMLFAELLTIEHRIRTIKVSLI